MITVALGLFAVLSPQLAAIVIVKSILCFLLAEETILNCLKVLRCLRWFVDALIAVSENS